DESTADQTEIADDLPLEAHPLEHHGEEEPAAEADKKGVFHLVETLYWRVLRWSLHHRWVIVILCFVAFFSSVPLLGMVNKEFIATDDLSEFVVSVRAPEGTSLAATSDQLEQIATEIRKLPDIKYTIVTVGADQQGTVNKGDITV